LPAPSARFNTIDSEASRKLICQVAPTSRQTLDDSVGQNQKLQRQVVDVQPFVIELHTPVYRRIPSTGCAFRARARAPNSGTGLVLWLPLAETFGMLRRVR
jgi:hypothetical protein